MGEYTFPPFNLNGQFIKNINIPVEPMDVLQYDSTNRTILYVYKGKLVQSKF
ncbi:hypothetical protein [Bacillus sp. FJAT-27231]|uniref:hypothetical protein n=1 Tax=Bacillus sp. FJAT-27231 TaxID=1679168 RepID=UPI000A45F0F0|nr:hypothetical protein [Bacillus sp. FJAT-27231]